MKSSSEDNATDSVLSTRSDAEDPPCQELRSQETSQLQRRVTSEQDPDTSQSNTGDESVEGTESDMATRSDGLQENLKQEVPSKRQKVEQMVDVPLMIPAAVCKDTKASLLVHLREERLDFSGDTGAIGRMTVSKKSKRKPTELTFDLKGQQFDGQILPTATVLIVGVGRTEAKVEGVFSEVCRLRFKGSVFDSMGGQIIRGEMDASYRYKDEDVNDAEVLTEGDDGNEDDKGNGAGARRPAKADRAKHSGKKRATNKSEKGSIVKKSSRSTSKKSK